jgi:hypothetical protein
LRIIQPQMVKKKSGVAELAAKMPGLAAAKQGKVS